MPWCASMNNWSAGTVLHGDAVCVHLCCSFACGLTSVVLSVLLYPLLRRCCTFDRAVLMKATQCIPGFSTQDLKLQVKELYERVNSTLALNDIEGLYKFQDVSVCMSATHA